MQKRNEKLRRHISDFNPDVMLLEDAYQDFFEEINSFCAGAGYENFDEFIAADAIDYKDSGDGVTYIVWNVLYNGTGCEIKRDLVAYYTLSATAIPYEDRIRRDEEEVKETGEEFDIEICGISAIEIKMFAVDENYQNVFFEYAGEDLPISAWIMKNIIDEANVMMNKVLGFKALFLHSVPEAEEFYLVNGFHPVEINMQPLHSVDSEYKAMYLALKEVHMNYDD